MEKKIMDTKTLNEVLNLYHAYQALYVNGPVVGLGSDYVQLEPEAMAEIIPGRIVTSRNRYEATWPVKLSVTVDGVKLIGLFSMENIVTLGLVSYLPEDLEPELEEYLAHLEPDDPVYKILEHAEAEHYATDQAIRDLEKAGRDLAAAAGQALVIAVLDVRK
jgi:hypothetical protein